MNTSFIKKFLGLMLGALIALSAMAQSVGAPPPPRILVFGDSLAAEYGLKRGAGWVRLMEDQLKKEGFPHQIINASISGETTAGGLTRLPALLKKHQPAIVVLELGANDGLRGLPIRQTRSNLERMMQAADAAGAKTVLVGIQVPPNYGKDYAQRFAGMFVDLAKARKSALVPFLLDGIAEDRAMFQADGIHPNESAQPKIFANVWPIVMRLL
jgi:acyl-CoA thioesterase I